MIWTVDRSLKHCYRCVIICSKISSTSAAHRTACKNSFLQDIIQVKVFVACGFIRLAEMDTGVPIGNNSSFSMIIPLIWSTEIVTPAWDVEPVSVFFSHLPATVSSNVILDEHQAWWFQTLFGIMDNLRPLHNIYNHHNHICVINCLYGLWTHRYNYMSTFILLKVENL